MCGLVFKIEIIVIHDWKFFVMAKVGFILTLGFINFKKLGSQPLTQSLVKFCSCYRNHYY